VSKMTSRLLSTGASWLPIRLVRPLSGVSLVVPFYHMVSDDHVPHVSHLYRFRSVAEFTSDVEFFARNFKPVALSDIVEALDGSRRLPKHCVHLTFDDGFREMHDVVAPILKRAGVPATFFLNTVFLDGGGLAHYNALSVLLDRIKSSASAAKAVAANLPNVLGPVKPGLTLERQVLSLGYKKRSLVCDLAKHAEVDLDRYVSDVRPILSSEQVRSLMKQGFTVGAHGHDHLLYSDLTLSEQLDQTLVDLKFLQTQFGVKPNAFAFPHNDDGVGSEFFDSIFSQRRLDVSFGTSGLVPHFHPRNIQRVTMEKTSAPAAQILARQFARATLRRFARPHRNADAASSDPQYS
jgi:peptidoglycan/xylan/chitin deacetylase (PgdA/CDA1 family)